ncbi:MAG: DUF6455 family protein [Pseudorhodoplanes sp.]|nr:DUF6455 family protein [Pseudorhodoplanes sp.]
MSTHYCKSADRKLANMSLMLTRRGIDPAEFAREVPAVAARAIMTCQQCAAGDVCRDWLARTGPGIERVPAFCPNALRFEAVT